jgi:hypothetical protein
VKFNAAHAALLWKFDSSERRILSVNSCGAKEIAEEAARGKVSKAIDAARTLAYDAARHSFVFCKLFFERELR